MERAVAALEDFPTLEALDGKRGVDALQEDVIAILEICPRITRGPRWQAPGGVRLLQREADNLRRRRGEDRSGVISRSRFTTGLPCWASPPPEHCRTATHRVGSAALQAALDGKPGIGGADPDDVRPQRLGERGRPEPRRPLRPLRVRRPHRQGLGPAEPASISARSLATKQG